ncbi:tRNA 2-thiouridine(34) synthase MnmA [Acaryochloris sp. IP29b_bin.137]|uniref:tRNA 2-thiouridine(34) synthase MnmA n=1 Tax=Acaryochloris sp. IP29b_bin.137 TaxID=2969217 RepID=UPI002633FEF5|nr:tRNA 2-thiouridine(34) synthase MnmA [Acaryochloris sp. IP29b_bin.137]
MKRIVVGLSGGVDSSTAAASLKEQGYEVIGLTLWLMQGKGQCCSDGLVDAAQLCDDLGIPHHIVDTRDLFSSNIIDYLVAGYQQGITPLPCSQCNKTVKFGPMLNYARQELDTDAIATGHYARIAYSNKDHRYQLLRAVDRHKDQSYFLYDLDQELLQGTVFPLGEYTKADTRRLAAQLNLHTAEKPESQDLCLIEAHGSMQTFLDQYIQTHPGEIVDQAGNVLGHHQGVHHFTIGQRKGIGVAAPHPLYVVDLDPGKNQVIVGDRDTARRTECLVKRVNWVSMAAPQHPMSAEVQVRYRSPPTRVTIIPLEKGGQGNDRVKLVFEEPQFGIAPGQAAVWYDQEILLGGGIIEPFS